MLVILTQLRSPKELTDPSRQGKPFQGLASSVVFLQGQFVIRARNFRKILNTFSALSLKLSI